MFTTRTIIGCLAALLLACAALVDIGFREAWADPIVRNLVLYLAGGPPRPIKILLMSDIHSQPSDMPPTRLARIVDEVNSLRPDLIVVAGDFLGDDGFGKGYPVNVAVAPLARLHARYGTLAVLGNHDRMQRVALRRNLQAVGVTLLEDRAVRIGPVSVGALSRRFSRATSDLLRLPGPRVFIAHTPEKFAQLPPGIDLMLAGHTHCGQIALPLVGPVLTGGKVPHPHACGIAREGRKVLVVTAGLGTSKVPLRLAAPPDMWLITIGSGHSNPGAS